MTVTEILRNTDKTLFSFEVLPPLRGKSIEQIYKTIDRLIDFNPAFIEITTHRNDYVYKEVKKDIYKRVEERLRPGTVAIAYAIKQKYNIPVVPHITNEIKSRFVTEDVDGVDTVAIIEIGGTAGDIESQPFLEAIRQLALEVGRRNCLFIHVGEKYNLVNTLINFQQNILMEQE